RQHRPVALLRDPHIVDVIDTHSQITGSHNRHMERYSTLPPRPPRISRIDELAVDLWWSWNEARAVFRRLDYAVWRSTDHNPVRMLWALPQERLDRAAHDPEFLALYDRAVEALDAARAAKNTWWMKT